MCATTMTSVLRTCHAICAPLTLVAPLRPSPLAHVYTHSLASSGVFGPGPGSAVGDGESRAGREGGGGGGRLSKLAYEDVQKSAALRDALAQHHYSQFTFTPRINETSRRIGRVRRGPLRPARTCGLSLSAPFLLFHYPVAPDSWHPTEWQN